MWYPLPEMSPVPSGYKDSTYEFADQVSGLPDDGKPTYGNLENELDLALDYRIELKTRCIYIYMCVCVCVCVCVSGVYMLRTYTVHTCVHGQPT
jgi:hypothetical protein